MSDLKTSAFGHPDRSRRTGVDSHGFVRCLGERDGDGVPIGYIDESGCCWENWEELVVATASGRFGEAWNRWMRTGGALGEMPTPMDFVDDTVDEELFIRVVKSCLEAVTFWQAMTWPRWQAEAQLN